MQEQSKRKRISWHSLSERAIAGKMAGKWSSQLFLPFAPQPLFTLREFIEVIADD